MTGAEAIAVVQLIDACIGITKTIIDIGRAVHDAQGLPPKLRRVFEQLPAIEDLLETAQERSAGGELTKETNESSMPALRQCEQSLGQLRDIFRAACPKDGDNRGKRIWKGTKAVFFGRDSQLQKLLNVIQENLRLLEQKEIYVIGDKLDALCQLAEDLAQDDSSKYTHTGAGNIVANEGGNPTNFVQGGEGNRQIFNPGSYHEGHAMYFCSEALVLPSKTYITIKSGPLFLVSYAEHSKMGWQDYWHEDQILEADQRRSVKIQNSTEDVDHLRRDLQNAHLTIQRGETAEGDIPVERNDSPSVGANWPVRLADFMSAYHEELIAQLSDFPEASQQVGVFRAMLRMTKGELTKDFDTGRTLLHWFAMNGVSVLMFNLIQVGFGVNDQDSDLRTPLHLAVLGNKYLAVKVLVEECDADVHKRDLNGLLPWNLAVWVDSDSAVDNDERLGSKRDILRLLSLYTDPDQVQTKVARQILLDLREDISADIVFKF